MRVGLVLAAGHSRRFGLADKLLAPFRGMPLAGWAAEAMRGVPLDHRMVVTNSAEVAELFGGYEILAGGGSEAGQADSLKIGAERAGELGADRLLVVLADMPFIRHGVMTEVLAGCADQQASAVSDGARRMPPACFPAAKLAELSSLTGDTGARNLLREVPSDALVKVPAAMLADVDNHEDLARLEAS